MQKSVTVNTEKNDQAGSQILIKSIISQSVNQQATIWARGKHIVVRAS
jgi:hypothetical protein